MRPAREPSQHLAWTARPLAELARLAWPITISTLSYSAMTLVGTLFVSRLGAASLAGVGLAGTVAFAIICFSIGLLRGVKVVVSQAVGAGRRDACAGYLGAGLLLAIALGLLAALVAQLVAPLLARLSASEEAGAAAATYLRIRLLGAPVLLMFVALRETRYGLGDARGPMVASVIANAVNIALDYTFIVRGQMGVAGAAWATVIAHSVELGVLAWAHRPASFGLRACTTRQIGEVFRVGWPTGLQFGLEVGSFLVLAALLSALSEVEMAAHQIALQVVHFSFLPAFAVGEAASVLAGQAVGADRDELVLRVARLAAVVGAIYTAACTAIVVVGAPLIARLFTDDPALRAAATALLYISAVFQIADGGNVVARGVLRGTGDVRVPAVIGIVTAWMLTPPLTWLLGYRAGLGAAGGWIGLCGEIILCTSLLWWRLVRGHWRRAARESRARVVATDATDPAAIAASA
jgi:MATE family multidrug resistance protein